jgi:hypothetical protein
MAERFPCPYFNTEVELSDPRIQHIQARHCNTWPNYRDEIRATLEDPDTIWRNDEDPDATLFAKWFDHIRTGRYIVTVVISKTDPKHHWIITAYTARRLPKHRPQP